MKRLTKILAVLLLLFNGLGALYGGWMLMADPTGKLIQLPLSALEHSPFTNFLVPGVVLFTCLGVFSFTALAALLFSIRHNAFYVLAEGFLLTGWIIVQLFMTQMYHSLQAVLGATGVLLIVCGWVLLERDLDDAARLFTGPVKKLLAKRMG